MGGKQMQSWAVDGSLDGVNWTEIDRKAKTSDENTSEIGLMPVSRSAECRFIRMTQTGKSYDLNDIMLVAAFEFFGTLLK
jgi:hypothetical protein